MIIIDIEPSKIKAGGAFPEYQIRMNANGLETAKRRKCFWYIPDDFSELYSRELKTETNSQKVEE